MQPLIKVTDTNKGINFSLDFIIEFLSLWQSNYSDPLNKPPHRLFLHQECGVRRQNITGIIPKSRLFTHILLTE
ncbi:hypothetical protein NUU79_02685 [Cronobacter sakazakii]|uniref:hypothetical protein n=1 Tax=Cronobacter sakazakii TaxID=28141 RepID=UPI0013FD5338|nr:hypothetical protein [Cronobacter sakazakii]MDQ1951795.1 hypothetical protein [Cronobacter sakazakii]MDQ1962483.1 hypothetical protein [Cronobacter sakazakii]